MHLGCYVPQQRRTRTRVGWPDGLLARRTWQDGPWLVGKCAGDCLYIPLHWWIVWGWQFLSSGTVAQCTQDRTCLCFLRGLSLGLWVDHDGSGWSGHHRRNQINRQFRRCRRSIHVHRIYVGLYRNSLHQLSVLAVRGARNRDGCFQSNRDVRWFFGCHGDRCQTGCVFQRGGCWLRCDRTLRSQNRQTH